MELQTPSLLRLIYLGVIAALAPVAQGAELNIWPFWVERFDEGSTPSTPSWTAVGPLFFSEPQASTDDSAETAYGLRPVYVRKNSDAPAAADTYVLYPLFSHHSTPAGTRWSVFSLINYQGAAAPAKSVESPPATDTRFDLWPFYFSRQTGSPATSYRAVLPVYGSVPYRFGQDRLRWVLFPLYARFEKNGVTTTTTPWPFVKILRGDGNRGFELWPLFGRREKTGAYREQFYLWPFGYKQERKLWQAEPDVKFGVLPFYARETSEGFRNESYLWPFFGYTDRTVPQRYHETRYFWPLFVQGRGDARNVNRWAPFYTHSVSKGVDKTWVLWPLWKQQTWTEAGLDHTRNQFLFFVYYGLVQRSATNPAVPAARKTHVWPLYSYWDNGAGRRQLQTLSPLAVFFPNNDTIRIAYNPLFALYRYDQQAPGDVRQSLLWNFITYRRTPQTREFHLGPLLGTESNANGYRRWTLGAGLVGLQREADDRSWRFFFFNFKRRSPSETPVNP